MKKYLLTTIIFLIHQTLFSQAPSNDNCTGAKDLNYANHFTLNSQTFTGATPSYNLCDHDVWFKFTTIRTGDFVFEDVGAGAYQSLYKIGVGGFVCNGGGGGTPPGEVPNGNYQYNVPAGTTYYIRVSDNQCGNYTGVTFRVKITGTAVSPALNDDCGFPYDVNQPGATEILMGQTLTNQNNQYSTASGFPPNNCGPAAWADDDVWYAFEVFGGSVNGTAIKVTSTNGKDPVIQLYDQCGTSNELYCSNNSTGTTELMMKRLPYRYGNQRYYIRVYSAETNADPVTRLMNFTISVKDTLIPANDDHCNATAITYNAASPLVNQTTTGSTKSANARPTTCSVDVNNNTLATGSTGDETDVWYKFNYTEPADPNGGTVITVKSTTAGRDPVFFLYSGGGGTGCEVVTNVMSCSNTAGDVERLRLKKGVLTTGMTYYIRVHEFFNNPMVFTVQAKDTIFAPNDICTGAINIPYNTQLTGRNNFNTTGPVAYQNTCTGPATLAEDDSWYKFTPTGSTAYVNITTTNNTNPVLYAYNIDPTLDCRTTAVIIACANTGGLTFESLVLTGLTPNKAYYLRVYDQQTNPMIFNIYAGNSPLPVSLGSFAGEHGASINVLRWTTLTEINNASFELQRSTNGTDYNTIATLLSKATGGNSTTPINYDYTDRTPAPGINYYRLKQIDKDGKTTLSPIVQLKGVVGKMLTLLGVYPNPATNAISVNIASPVQQPITMIVTDITGKIIKQQTEALPAGEKTFSMNVAALQPGSYFIKAVCKDGCQSQYLRFNKN